MPIIKQITSDAEAKEQLLKGVEMCEKVVGDTMGYRGRTTLIETDGNKAFATKDGKNSLDAIFLLHPIQSLAVEIIKEAVDKTLSEAGDGTSNTVVLAHSFVKYALEELGKGKSPIDIRNAIEKSREIVINHIKSISKEVDSKLIYDVAYTSANSDESIAQIVSDAFLNAGEDGTVTHLRSETDKTHLENIEGTLVEGGYTDDRFINIHSERAVRFEDNPLIVISEISFKTWSEIKPFIEYAHTNQRELILVSEMEYALKETIITNVLSGKLKCAAVQPPSFGERRRDYLADLALVCGCSPITSLSGNNFVGRELDFIGVASKVIVTKKDTIIIPFEETETAPVLGKISELKEVIEKSTNGIEKEYMRDRVAKLSSRTSIIRVGGITPVEQDERIDRVDDAVCAVRSAKEMGVVAGGGMALFESAGIDTIDELTRKAIVSPFHRILKNAGVDLEHTYKCGYPVGYDVKDFRVVDMYDARIVDSVKVIENALNNATSVAIAILMTNNVITNHRVTNG